MFEFSGMSDLAAVTVRENDVNAYLVRELPDRMTNASSPAEREAVGMFFANYLIPDDFRKLAEGNNDLTIEVDETTAALPWEMAAHKKYSKMGFLGTSVAVSRQFRTLLSPAPGSPPPLNRVHKILIIADPAPGSSPCRMPERKAWSVVDVLDQARKAWAGEYEFRVTVRIGSHQNAEELAPAAREPAPAWRLDRECRAVRPVQARAADRERALRRDSLRRPRCLRPQYGHGLGGYSIRTASCRRRRSSACDRCRAWSSPMPAFQP